MREARIVADGQSRTVRAFTEVRELVIGTIDAKGRFTANDAYKSKRELLPSWPADASVLTYDAAVNALFYEVDLPGPQLIESLDFLPLELTDAAGKPLAGEFAIDFAPSVSGSSAEPAIVSLTFTSAGKATTLAKAPVPLGIRRADLRLGSFDNKIGAYATEAAYRAAARGQDDGALSVTFPVVGEFTGAVQSDEAQLAVVDIKAVAEPAPAAPPRIAIDGNFDDWRNVAGVDDPLGDLAPYLEYVPDVDLLEFKIANDDSHIYLYSRVAGRVGHSHPNGGRSYFYAYMDVDRNAGTGFLPTRDDDCYFGVDIGDDCEVQFEFVDGALRKTFYGFCGLGGDGNVLKQQVTLGKSQYGRLDERGRERANYKSEYIYRDGVTEITEDLKLGTSDTIRLAVSPDGSEVEVVSSLAGFLKDPQGKPTLSLGQSIDVAAGMECDSKAYPGKSRWAADSTIAIRGYKLRSSESRTASREQE
jgi:hypothetical protein